MKIGVLSDTHDRLGTTAEAIRLLRDAGAELILHCGDIETAATVRLFADIPTHFVFGNWDGRTASLLDAMAEVGATHHPDFGHLVIDGQEIAWVHSHKKGQLRELEHSGLFDYLFYGHSHYAESHRTGRTLVANPGAIHRARPKTCLVVDVATGKLRSLEVEVPKGR
jgi:putative phosphoesterase